MNTFTKKISISAFAMLIMLAGAFAFSVSTFDGQGGLLSPSIVEAWGSDDDWGSDDSSDSGSDWGSDDSWDDGDCCDSGTDDSSDWGSDDSWDDGDCCDYSQSSYYSQSDYYSQSSYYEETLPTCDYLTANGQSSLTLPYWGGSVYLEWGSTDADSATLTPDGSAVSVDGHKTVDVYDDVTYILRVTNSDGSDSCRVDIEVEDPEIPELSCQDVVFTASDYVVSPDSVVNLAWVFTGNVESASLNPNVADPMSVDNVDVTISETSTYTIDIANSVSEASCPLTIVVEEEPDSITCEANANFTATPTNLGVGGGNVTLAWNAVDADSVKLDGVAVATNYSQVVNVTANTTFTLEVTGDDTTAGNTVSCPISVTVETDENSLTCDDVSFTASDTSVREGDRVTLSWSVSDDVDEVSIDNGIGDVNKNDSTIVTVNDDITYNITIENADSSRSCPLSIDAESGGGGGGSPSPRCELDISDEKITLGESVTLEWETTRVYEMTIVDDEGNIIVTTGEKGDDDYEKDLLDGDIKIKPTKDTEYTLNGYRGSKKRTCRVEVEVENNITVLETRNQEPRVAGISLTQVPYTGFEAGPVLTMVFYGLLTLWALFVAYVVVLRRDGISGVSYAGAHEHNQYLEASVAGDLETTETNAAEAFVAASTATVAETEAEVVSTSVAPSNLPVAAPVATPVAQEVVEEVSEEDEFAALENYAHEKRVLLSTDAMRSLVAKFGTGEAGMSALDNLIESAKTQFPSEDGWMVLNLTRVESLLDSVEVKSAPTAEVEAVEMPDNAGSLAEAIVTGNIVAAYQMIGHRPMVALAAAAADLDALKRNRGGEETNISDLLQAEGAKLTTEQLDGAIAALTGAIDGVYTDEAEAVKMSILKAVNTLA